jgi:lipopolysaccharide export system permease protein
MMKTARAFYATRAPAVFLLLLPYTLLLALLYSLGKLSGSREIIAMIQAGRSVVRITLPLILAGIIASLLCLGLNYQWAPTAEAKAEQILSESSGKTPMDATNVLYRNSVDRRLWEIGGFPQDYQMGKPLRNVEVTTTRHDKTLESRLFAKEALWNRHDQTWTFQQPVMEEFSADHAPVFRTMPETLSIQNWSETPWQLIKPGLTASELGIPDLNTWLKANTPNPQFTLTSGYLTQWHYRWALPFTCLVTVLLATPLGIHFSRRGAGGGVFLAVALSALMMLLGSISLALGESGIIQPMLAAWLPNITFTLVGFYLFHRRISGRPIYRTLRQLVPGND